MNFSRDGHLLAAGTWDGKVEVWNLIRKERVAIWRTHQYPPTDVNFLPDGKRLVTVSTDATAKLWEIETQQPLKTFVKTRNAFIALTTAPDGQRIAAGTDDGFIRIWNETTGREVATLKCGTPHEGFALQFLPTDGNTLVSLRSREVRIWRAPSWEDIAKAEANAHARREKEY
jgi:WD40 repeat protein